MCSNTSSLKNSVTGGVGAKIGSSGKGRIG